MISGGEYFCARYINMETACYGKKISVQIENREYFHSRIFQNTYSNFVKHWFK